ncbi:hypothetical protein Tco_0550487 [Tanacetum coccineum]
MPSPSQYRIKERICRIGGFFNPSKAICIERFIAPNSKYVFSGIYVAVIAKDEQSLATAHPHIPDILRGEGEEEGLEKAYLELFDYVVDNIHVVPALQPALMKICLFFQGWGEGPF